MADHLGYSITTILPILAGTTRLAYLSVLSQIFHLRHHHTWGYA
jgi:hypothetical protein